MIDVLNTMTNRLNWHYSRISELKSEHEDRIDALESEVRRLVLEVRRLSGNQGSAYSGGDVMEAMRMADQYCLDKARLDMELKAIYEGRG